MRVHHINSGTMRPLGGRLLGGSGLPWSSARLVCHVLAVESPDGIVLVDTGVASLQEGTTRHHVGVVFSRFVRPSLDPDETVAHQLTRLGFSAADVRHIVLTHLDLDHAGGLPDFPDASVHVLEAEHAAAIAPQTRSEKLRYRSRVWQHGVRWMSHVGGERWMGFEAARILEAVGPDLVLVPLIGHTRGHAGVAVRTDAGWILHAGDAYFHRSTVRRDAGSLPPLLGQFERIVAIDRQAVSQNHARLLNLASEHPEIRVFCAHDPTEFSEFERSGA